MKPIHFNLFILLILHCGLYGQQQSENVIWDNIIFHQDLIYGKQDTTSQVLDIYMQGEFVGESEWYIHDSVKRKTLIHFHGGGWLLGDKSSIVGISSELLIYPFLQNGYNVVNVGYREGPGTAPEAIEDVLCALSWIKQNADIYNIDIKNLVLMGESAGGHLALVAGFTHGNTDFFENCNSSNEIIVKAIINIAGITDIENAEIFMRSKSTYNWNYPLLWIGDTKRIKSISRKYSPIYLVTNDSPPVITGHGKLDQLVPYQQAVSLKSVLDKNNIPNRLLLFDDGKHMSFGDEGIQRFYGEVFTFLDELGVDE